MACELLRRKTFKPENIKIIAPKEYYCYQPDMTLVGANRMNFKETCNSPSKHIPQSIKRIKIKAKYIDAKNNFV